MRQATRHQPGREIGAAAPKVVLDTNVVLDWLVFRDARTAGLAVALASGRLPWLACPRMREEVHRVLGYPALERWRVDPARVLASFDHHATPCGEPPRLAQPALICSDHDDQVFLDLAVAHQARWLLTHDRALLKLARAARRHGVEITRPTDWVAP